MYKYRVLMTSAGGALGAKNIKAMKNSFPGQVWVLAVDIGFNLNAEILADKFITVSSGDSNNYISQICKVIKENKINKVLPCSDEEAITLSKNKEKIESLGCGLLTADYASIKIMSNKIKTYELLKKYNIDVPIYYKIDSFKRLDDYAINFMDSYGSFVIKNPVARGNRGTILVDKNIDGKINYMGSREIHVGWDYFKNKIRPKIEDSFPKIITERLFSPAYDVDVLAKGGDLVHAVPRERINPAGVPYKGNIIRYNRNLINLATKVAKALNLSYLYDIDIMTTKDGAPVILEVNPRPSGSCVASIESGVPLFKDLLRLYEIKVFNKSVIPKDGTTLVPFIDFNTTVSN